MLSDYILVDQLSTICIDIFKIIHFDFLFYINLKIWNFRFEIVAVFDLKLLLYSIWNCCYIRLTCQRDHDDDGGDNDSDESETKIK